MNELIVGLYNVMCIKSKLSIYFLEIELQEKWKCPVFWKCTHRPINT